MAGKLFIISAPSGAGKTTLVNALIDRYGFHYNIERVITYTSKKPRVSDRHGVDYHFVRPEEFELKIAQGFFMEWSGAYEAYYGSPRHVLDHVALGRSFLLIIDRAGAQQILKTYPAAVPVWIYTRSINDLYHRLVLRNTEEPDHIERRFMRAKDEVLAEITTPMYKYHVLNQDFDSAVTKVFTIIKRELL